MAVTKIDSKKIPVKAPAKKRGRPAGVKNKPKTQKPVDWEALAKKLQRALAAEIKKNDELEWGINVYRQHFEAQEHALEQLENRGWLSRLFNLK